ncbi:MAG: D-alanyl-D-alanine carboxypeptidase/D-alanyl-D-alanine-endopeptidase [Ignavibacteriaceae bacterium]|jgi:D-alanyl-D-alanine carboxypeptidase/D-alanyl-D-alanine-endopeptidase (penicillin-binding protein 4)
MKSYLFILLVLLTQSIFPQRNILNLRSRIDSLLADSFFDTTQIAVDVYDFTLNEKLYGRNEKFLLRPASNMKILTMSAALVFLGTDYNFTTSLCYTGEIKNGILFGDLYVIGGCDPVFSSKDLDSLAAVVKSLGISEIRGNLIGDVSMMDSLYWGKGWMYDDDCAYLTPLDINANSIGVVVNPRIAGQRADVLLIPQTDFVELNNFSVTVPADSPDTFILEKDWLHHKNILTIRGNVSAKPVSDSLQDTLHTKVYEPQVYFLTLFQEALLNRGISISGKKYFAGAPSYSKDIFSFKRPFAGMVNYINKKSYNLGAEMILRALAAKCLGVPATADNGIKMIDSLIALTGLNPNAYRLVDGSGISHYNLVSALLLLEVLKYMYFQKPDLYKILYESFPVAGVDGTLSNRMKSASAQNKVHAKTGTLSGVSCLSGYVTADNGHLLAFSIILQNFTGSSKAGKDYEDKICNILAEYQ